MLNIRSKKIRTRRKLTYNIIQRAKVAAELSFRQTNKFLAHLRHGVGRGWMVPRVREQLVESNKLFDGDFVSEYVEMKISSQEQQNKF